MIDLSGDSAWNPRAPTLAEARAAALDAGIVINALAVLCDNCSGRQGTGNLEQQFRDRVIAGPGAFVVTADSRESFADAVRRKLVLEIAGRCPAREGAMRIIGSGGGNRLEGTGAADLIDARSGAIG